jgi:RNA polymerase subunit RPABC4/transcription elongation factor Spt4
VARDPRIVVFGGIQLRQTIYKSKRGEMMLCEKCGASLPEGTKFCGRCGAQQRPAGRYCPSCHKPVEEGLFFCPECGARVGAAKADEVKPVPGPPKPFIPQGKGVYVVNYQVNTVMAHSGKLHFEPLQLHFRPYLSLGCSPISIAYRDIVEISPVGVVGNLIEIALCSRAKYRFRLNPWDVKTIMQQLEEARLLQG